MTHDSPRQRTVLTARNPEDLLAVAPVVLGFWPADSIVMLTFDADQPFHARVDLPAPGDPPGTLGEVADLLVAPAAHHGVGRVVLLVYTDDAELAAAAYRALGDRLAVRGILVVEALRVEPGRWYPLQGGQGGHGRAATGAADGVAYDVSSHPFLVQAVVEGRVTHGTRDDLAATLAPDDAGVVRVRERLAARSGDGSDGPADVLAEGTWARALVARHLDAGTMVGDSDAARLLAAMRSTTVRDAVWSATTRERSPAGVALFTDLVRRAPVELLPAPAGLLAWAAWQAGNGALAWCAVDRCREVDPEHGLAGIIAEALARAVPPSAVDAPFDWDAHYRTG